MGVREPQVCPPPAPPRAPFFSLFLALPALFILVQRVGWNIMFG